MNENEYVTDERERCRLLINEFKNCIVRLKEIIGATKIKPIFKVQPEDEGLLERSEND